MRYVELVTVIGRNSLGRQGPDFLGMRAMYASQKEEEWKEPEEMDVNKDFRRGLTSFWWCLKKEKGIPSGPAAEGPNDLRIFLRRLESRLKTEVEQGGGSGKQ